jgi:cytochrome d ubiquinol oxidase subunit I
VLAEIGRQPWAIDGVLPTFLGASDLTIPQLWTTIAGFTLIYGTLAIVEVKLMLEAIRKGPDPVAPLEDQSGLPGGYTPIAAE